MFVLILIETKFLSQVQKIEECVELTFKKKI